MRGEAKTAACSPLLALRPHPHSHPIAAIPSQRGWTDRIRTASLSGATNTLDSNPHSSIPPPASGKLPAVSSLEAYPTPTAGPADLPVSGKLIDAGAVLANRHSAVGIG